MKIYKKSEAKFTTASFFKLLCDHEFTSQLRIPPQFVKNHGKKLSEKAKLVAAESADSWVVRIERIGDHHFFTDGWTRFSHHAHLKFWEFLLFKFVGKSTFEVSLYGINGCKKEISFNWTDNFDSKEECEYKSESDQTTDSGDKQVRSFVKKLTRNHTSELEIPKDLAVGTGLIRNKKLKLKDEKGKKWPIYVSKKECGKIAMTVGWNEFLTGSGVAVGSKICLEFVGNIIGARVVKKGSEGGELFSSCVEKRRGRPPKLQD